MTIAHCLTIAGSDPSGGAGIQADLKTFSALGTYGMSVIAGLTAQNTKGVQEIYPIAPEFVGAQLHSILDDVRVDVIKIGMLGQAGIIDVVADILQKRPDIPVILDPVMNAKSGDDLLMPDAVAVLRQKMLPLAYLVTPNLPEAARLTGMAVTNREEMEAAGRYLIDAGCQAALIKGGHLDDGKDDVLVASSKVSWLAGEVIATKNTHGTGCTLSSAIAALTAKNLVEGGGKDLLQILEAAKAYVTQALRHADQLDVGEGIGPTHHFWDVWM